MKLKYRPEIDGLRALAVIPVIFFHAEFSFFNGGYVGVDIFFVISGYLISSIILGELNNKSFSLKNFYERRARRILPPLILVILVSLIFSFVFLTTSELSSYLNSVFSTILFYSNFYFWKTAPYFQNEEILEPLLHTWSLSIEEQFYIVFPITLIFFYKFFRKHILLFLFFGLIFSFVVCQFLALKTNGVLNFYFTFSRAWELALGGICAYIIFYKKIFLSHGMKNLLSFVGFGLILFCVFYFDKLTPHPSFYTILPTLGTALIILFADKNSLVKKFFSIKLLVYLGLISYSLYLWHQPLLVFGRLYFENFLNFQKFIVIIVSLFFSILSYHLIEKTFRNKKKINLSIFLKIFLPIIFLLLLFTYISSNFFESKNSTEAMLAKILEKRNLVQSVKMDDRQFIKNRIIYENMDPKILIIGSSRVMQISNKNFDKKIINLAVNGASIEDHVAITEMALEKFNPDLILLGVDPWLFNKHDGQSRWESIFDEYKLALENIKLMNKKNIILDSSEKKIDYSFYENILQSTYNFLNIRKLILDNNRRNTQSLEGNIILRDGSRLIKEQIERREIKPTVINYSMQRYVYSEENHEIYKKFLEYLKDIHKKQLVLVLVPYSSPSYELSVETKPYYLEIEKKFKQLSKQLNIKIIGSYNSLNTKCDETEFLDNMHPNSMCMIKITNQIKIKN